jgi:hypothetical protein
MTTDITYEVNLNTRQIVQLLTILEEKRLELKEQHHKDIIRDIAVNISQGKPQFWRQVQLNEILDPAIQRNLEDISVLLSYLT